MLHTDFRAMLGNRRSVGRLSEFSLTDRRGPLLLAVIVALAFYFAFDGPGPGFILFLQLCAATVIPFTALALVAFYKGIDAPWGWILPVGLLGVFAGGLASAAIANFDDPDMLGNLRLILPDWSLGAAFSIFFVGLSLATTAVRREEQIEFDASQRLLEARLQTLTARIEPHFLMNTLANLSALIETRPQAASEMLEHLTDLLKAALDQSRNLNSTLGQELELIDSYLTIMKFRLADKLEFTIDADDSLRDMPFPALLLQTLVENAVRHGIEPSASDGTVSIAARRDGENILVTVLDDGVGFEPHRHSEGTGLQNARDRLDSFFAGAASFELESFAGQGTCVRIGFARGAQKHDQRRNS